MNEFLCLENKNKVHNRWMDVQIDGAGTNERQVGKKRQRKLRFNSMYFQECVHFSASLLVLLQPRLQAFTPLSNDCPSASVPVGHSSFLFLWPLYTFLIFCMFIFFLFFDFDFF